MDQRRVLAALGLLFAISAGYRHWSVSHRAAAVEACQGGWSGVLEAWGAASRVARDAHEDRLANAISGRLMFESTQPAPHGPAAIGSRLEAYWSWDVAPESEAVRTAMGAAEDATRTTQLSCSEASRP